MAKLLILQDGQSCRIHELQTEVVTIGRGKDADIVLLDSVVSRKHIAIELQPDKSWLMRDLHSVNGTFVNRISVTEHPLRNGDEIRMGSSTIFFVGAEQSAQPATAGVGDSSMRQQLETASRKIRNLNELLELNKALTRELDKRRLLDLIMDKAIKLTGAERGFLILWQNNRLNFEVARNLDETMVDQPEFNVSRNIIKQVFSTGEPILTSNAQTDFGQFLSVAALDLHCLMCAPLKLQERMLGMIYVDSRITETLFEQGDLNLLQAFADLAAIALESARLFTAAVASRNRERHARQVFQKYVPAQVVNEVLQKKAESLLTGRRQKVSVLFSDIRNFTPLAESMDSEALVTFLNDFLGRMGTQILEEQGVLDKYIGDSIMALFGAPVQHPKDAHNAVKAAVRMCWELERLNQERVANGQEPINIGVGVHTGEVIAGNIGSEHKMDYTVIGDAVNLAARLESLNKQLNTNILISEETYKEIRGEDENGDYRFEKLDAVPVKGKTGLIQVYQVIPTPLFLDDAPPLESSQERATQTFCQKEIDQVAQTSKQQSLGEVDEPTL